MYWWYFRAYNKSLFYLKLYTCIVLSILYIYLVDTKRGMILSLTKFFLRDIVQFSIIICQMERFFLNTLAFWHNYLYINNTTCRNVWKHYIPGDVLGLHLNGILASIPVLFIYGSNILLTVLLWQKYSGGSLCRDVYVSLSMPVVVISVMSVNSNEINPWKFSKPADIYCE